MRYLQRRPEWVVVIGGVAAALHVGKVSPALPVLRESLGVDLVQAGFLLSTVQFAGMLLGLAVGVLADGIGLKRSLLIGLAILSLAGALGAGAHDAAGLLLLRGCEGFGFLLAVTSAPGLIRRLTPADQLSAALGVWGAFMPLGTALALWVGPSMIQLWGWRGWWLLLALLSALVAIWLWRVVPPDGSSSAARADRSAATVSASLAASASTSVARLVRTVAAPGPWLVALAFAFYSGQWLAVIGFLPSIVAQSGQSGFAAASLLALAALVNIVGNIASGRLLQHEVAPQYLLYAGFAAMALGAGLAFADVAWTASAPLNLALRYGGVLLFSTFGGLIPGTLFSMAVRLAPDESSVSSTVGWMQQWSALGQFLGPPLVAWVAARAGSWNWTWLVTGGCCVLGGVVAQRIGARVVHVRV